MDQNGFSRILGIFKTITTDKAIRANLRHCITTTKVCNKTRFHSCFWKHVSAKNVHAHFACVLVTYHWPVNHKFKASSIARHKFYNKISIMKPWLRIQCKYNETMIVNIMKKWLWIQCLIQKSDQGKLIIILNWKHFGPK